MKLKMNFMELYNYFVMHMPNLCDDNCRNMIKSHEDDAQLGVDPVTEKYIAPFNLDHRYEQIIEWDTELDSIVRDFDSIGEYNRKNLIYVINGEKLIIVKSRKYSLQQHATSTRASMRTITTHTNTLDLLRSWSYTVMLESRSLKKLM